MIKNNVELTKEHEIILLERLLLLICVSGMLGAVLTLAFSVFIRCFLVVTVVQIVNLIVLSIAILRVKRKGNLFSLSVFITIFYIVEMFGSWMSTGLSVHSTRVLVVYVGIISVGLLDNKIKKVFGCIQFAMLIFMMVFDINYRINNTIEYQMYLREVLGTIIIGGMIISLVSFYGKRVKNTQDKLYRYSIMDSLTGAYNIRHFRRNIDINNEAWKVNQQCYSVAIIDVDDFKQVNDIYGHQAGDLALKFVANNILEVIRRNDLLCRYGGDEFAILFPNTSNDEGKKLVKAIIKQFAKNKLQVDNKSVSISVSIGIGDIREAYEIGIDVLGLADKRMYVAKDTGKNKVCYK